MLTKGRSGVKLKNDRSERRLHIPQHDFGFTPHSFILIQDAGLDANLLGRERDEANRARHAAHKGQPRINTYY